MLRKGLLPPPPPEIQGLPITVKYVSLFAETQRAASTTAIEKLLSLTGSMAGLSPDILDNIDTDKTIDLYANQLNVPPEILRATKEVLAIRQARAQQQQQQ